MIQKAFLLLVMVLVGLFVGFDKKLAAPDTASMIAYAAGPDGATAVLALDAAGDRQRVLAKPIAQSSPTFTSDGNACKRDINVIGGLGGGGGGEPVRFSVDEDSDAIISILSPDDPVWEALFLDRGGQFAVVQTFDALTIWNADQGWEIGEVGDGKALRSPVVSQEAELFAAIDDDKGEILLWELYGSNDAGGEAIVDVGVNDYGSANAYEIALSPDGEWLAAATTEDVDLGYGLYSNWGVIRVFDVDSGREVWRLEGDILEKAEIIEEKTDFGSQLQVFPATMKNGHASPVDWMAFSPDSRYLLSSDYPGFTAVDSPTYGNDATIRIWDLQTGRHLRCLEPGSQSDPMLSPDGRELATRSGRTIFIWDIARSRVDRRLHLPPELQPTIQDMAYIPDGKKIVVTTGEDQTARVLNSQTGRLTGLMRLPGDTWKTTVSADGRRIMVESSVPGEDDELWIWNATHPALRVAAAAQALVDLGLEAARKGDIDEMWAAFDEAQDYVPEDDVLLRPQVWEAACRLGSLDAAEDALDVCDRALAEAEAAGLNDFELRPIEKSREKAQLLALFEANPDHDALKTANDWNRLCWFGSLDGQASSVLQECELAVKMSNYRNPAIRDSRGLARALSGDYDGAIEDFWYFVDYGSNFPTSSIRAREGFIAALSDGINPFDGETLQALRDE